MSKPTPTTITSLYNNDNYNEAIKLMSNRMTVSEQKYGPVENNYPHIKSSYLSLRERLDLYLETGNTEWLLDVANFAIIEFILPSHPKAHFRATDSDESPGLRDS